MNPPLIDHFTEGFAHMAGGWDHLLFVGGIVLLARTPSRAAKLISAFVLGHSITLLVASLEQWRVDPVAVDVIIALSLVVIGLTGSRGPTDRLRPFGVLVFCFGLVHGLGLGTRLQELGLPDDDVVARILLFNVGVETAQLLILAVAVALGSVVARDLRDRDQAARYIAAAIAASGALGALGVVVA
jgi:hydrogenase/urease accessory protein HupE